MEVSMFFAPNDKIPEIEITQEMIDAGENAANLIGYKWGWDSDREIVCRVYRAMVLAKNARGEPTGDATAASAG
jgi:hypothetical protein